MKDLNLLQLGNKITGVFKRFHMTIFIVIITVGLMVVVLMLNSTINLSTDNSSYSPEVESASFDKDTIDQIEELQQLNQSGSSTKLPSGRINPFVE